MEKKYRKCCVKWNVSDEVDDLQKYFMSVPITPYNDKVHWYQMLIVAHIKQHYQRNHVKTQSWSPEA